MAGSLAFTANSYISSCYHIHFGVHCGCCRARFAQLHGKDKVKLRLMKHYFLVTRIFLLPLLCKKRFSSWNCRILIWVGFFRLFNIMFIECILYVTRKPADVVNNLDAMTNQGPISRTKYLQLIRVTPPFLKTEQVCLLFQSSRNQFQELNSTMFFP